MLKKEDGKKERIFSIELKSATNLKNVTLTRNCQEKVLIEGTIGELQHATFAEGSLLEIVGTRGILRIDVTESELKNLSEKGAD